MTPIGKVFLSHSSKDKAFVDRLVADLAKHSIPVWYDKLDVRLGDSIPGKINKGLAEAKYFAIVLTPSSVASRWVQEELNAALVRQIAESGTFLLPLLLADCTLPPLLAHRHHADFRSSYDAGLQELLDLWGKDAAATAALPAKTLYPWPDPNADGTAFVYLHSERFDKFFRMACGLDWTADRAIDYITATLQLPWNKEMPELGLKWSFSYGLRFNDDGIGLHKRLSEAGVGTGSVLKLSISGTYEDLYEKQLKEIWNGNVIYNMTATPPGESIRQAMAQRGPLTQSRIREIANSCFKHI